SAPNSFFPIFNRSKEDTDFYAPTYLTPGELRKYIKPLKPNPEVYKIDPKGMEFNYTTDKKDDFDSQYVMAHRQFYGKLCQENLINNSKKSSNVKKELQLPITMYEPTTFIKRFC